MKKIVSALLVFVLAIGMIFTLVSCGKTLSGTYKHSIVNKTYTFKGNEVTVNPLIGDAYTIKYEITEEDGQLYITFIYDEGDTEDEDLKGKLTLVEGEEAGVEYIKIGGSKYNKQ